MQTAGIAVTLIAGVGVTAAVWYYFYAHGYKMKF
jgi:hypothetical protein